MLQREQAARGRLVAVVLEQPSPGCFAPATVRVEQVGDGHLLGETRAPTDGVKGGEKVRLIAGERL